MSFPHRLVQVHASFWMFFLFSFMVIVHFHHCPLPLPGQRSVRIRPRQNDTDQPHWFFSTVQAWREDPVSVRVSRVVQHRARQTRLSAALQEGR
jgi:hypothetical protein